MNKREKQVYSYMVALSRLYGVLDWRQFIKVFNKYNFPKITKKEILSSNTYWQKGKTYYAMFKDVLVSVMGNLDAADEVFEASYNQKYYMPSEEEILSLSKPRDYYEKSPAHIALYEEIEGRIMLKEGEDLEKKLKKIRVGICLKISSTVPLIDLIDYLIENGVEVFRDEDDQDFIDAFMDAWNNTRLWANKGFYPLEVAEKEAKEEEKEEPKTSIRIFEEPKNATAKRFYKLWYELIYWINSKYKIVSYFKKPAYGEEIDEILMYKVREKLWENPIYINEFLKTKEGKALNDMDKKALNSWRTKFIKGKFLVQEHIENYSILQTFDLDLEPEQLYAVHGLSQTIEVSLRNRSLPQIVSTVLLPFEGKIIYDSILGLDSFSFGGGMLSMFEDFYNEAKKSCEILKSL